MDSIYICSENSTKALKTTEGCQVTLFMSATLDNSGAAMFLLSESYHYGCASRYHHCLSNVNSIG